MERRSNSDGGNDGCGSNAMHNNNKKERRSDSPANEKWNQKKKTKHNTVSSTALTVATTTNSAPSSSNWTNTPIALLLRTLGYLDNASLIAMCLVCKQICTIIQDGHGMEQKLIRLFELRAADASEDRHSTFILNMRRYFENPIKNRILTAHQKVKVYNMRELIQDLYGNDVRFDNVDNYDDYLQNLIGTMRMPGVVELDISSPIPISNIRWSQLRSTCASYLLPYFHRHLKRKLAIPLAFSWMAPNLRHLDCSNVSMLEPFIVEEFARRCPLLEVLKRNNIDHLSSIAANGEELSLMQNLREVYLDNCYFETNAMDIIEANSEHNENEPWNDHDSETDDFTFEYNAMANLHPHKYPTMYLFSKLCNKPLERVSIKNARYYEHDTDEQYPLDTSMLIKFIRHAPSTLTWFRSDLPPAVMRVLQSEKPHIEFVN